jgi:hypothetical protein
MDAGRRVKVQRYAPVPWLLLSLVVVTVVAAIFASDNTQRLVALAIAEGSIVVYFCVGLMHSAPRAILHADVAAASDDAPNGE